MAQYLLDKGDLAKVRHIHKACPDVKAAIREGKAAEGDLAVMTSERLDAHRKEHGHGDGTDGRPNYAGRCPTCWNQRKGGTGETPNEREDRIRSERAEREAKKVDAQKAKGKDGAKAPQAEGQKRPAITGQAKAKDKAAA